MHPRPGAETYASASVLRSGALFTPLPSTPLPPRFAQTDLGRLGRYEKSAQRPRQALSFGKFYAGGLVHTLGSGMMEHPCRAR